MKKIIFPLLVIVITISCKDNIKIKIDGNKTTTALDSASNFEGFKSAIINNDDEAIKKYIKFPLETRNIFNWIYVRKEEMTHGDEEDITLHEEDYEGNRDKMFPPAFGECLKKVKLDKLVKKLNITTRSITDENGDKFKMDCIYDNDVKLMELHFIHENPIVIRENDSLGQPEYNDEELERYRNKIFDEIVYTFEVKNKKVVKLIEIEAYK